MAEQTDCTTWRCRRCGRTLAIVENGEPDPRMDIAQQVTRMPDRFIYVCECGYVQVWLRQVAIDTHPKV